MSTDPYVPDETELIDSYAGVMDEYIGQDYDQAKADAQRGIAKIKADALREVARGYWGVDGDPDYPCTSGNTRRTLNARADRIEEET